MKKKILFSGEASFLSTGFAKFNRGVLEALHATGKYEIAEFGSYAQGGAPEAVKLPWKFYGALPTNAIEKQIYDSNPINQFGKYKIDAVLADFQPDIVFDARDPWMSEHLASTRYRKNYKLVLMPTVDSAPQRLDWIKGMFANADVLTTYSRYGRDVLREAGLNVQAVTSPGLDLEVFKPLDTKANRDEFHMTDTLLIFGSVMRNQKRKLIPDLLNAYRQLRDRYAKNSLVKRAKEKVREKKKLSKEEIQALRISHSALYLHTSWPENRPETGWDLPEYLRRYQLQRHVVFTYKCEACKAIFPDWFAPCDAAGMRVCRQCGEQKAHMPNTHSGITESELVKVYNLFDVYIQLAICEGWGLPIMESKACGVPGAYQNFSAMKDHVQNGGGVPINLATVYHEAETVAIRSLPDIEHLISQMSKLAFDEKYRRRLGKEARECAVKMHDWSITNKKLEDIFDSLDNSPREETWDAEPVYQDLIQTRPPSGLNNSDFVIWLYLNILNRAPDQQGYDNWMSNLSKGASRDAIENFFRSEINNNNKFEEVRWIKSCQLRGIDLPQSLTNQANVHVDSIPGVTL